MPPNPARADRAYSQAHPCPKAPSARATRAGSARCTPYASRPAAPGNQSRWFGSFTRSSNRAAQVDRRARRRDGWTRPEGIGASKTIPTRPCPPAGELTMLRRQPRNAPPQDRRGTADVRNMRHPSLASRLAALVSFSCLAVPPAAAEPRETRAAHRPVDPSRPSHSVVIAGRGEARDRNGAAWHAIAPGTPVSVGAELRAPTEAVRVEFRGGATIELAPESRAALFGELDLVFADYGKLTVARVELRRGELSVVTTPSSSSPRSCSGPSRRRGRA